MNENQIVEVTIEMLGRNTKFDGRFQHWLPIADDGLDGELQFRIPAHLPTFKVQVKRELRHYQLPYLEQMAKEHENYMIMAEKISPSIKEELRANNINYVDAAGNIFIKTPKQTIWIDGHKYKPAKKTGTNKAFTKTGLKTVFYLLIHEEAINYPYRKLAEATGVALGNIKNILQGLNEAGFILRLTKNTLKIQNKKTLLERWITAYSETLRPTLFLGAFHFWKKNKFQTWHNLSFEPGQTAWGGEPAGDILTNYLRPEILTIYTNEKSRLVSEWQLVPDENGGILMYEKFWKDELLDQKQHVPPLLAYTDLILTNDPRCLETANKIYEKYLKHDIEGD